MALRNWRTALALIAGVVWWWAALRMVLVPAGAGVVEGAVVTGGWGLSLLPVHCVPWRPGQGRTGGGGAAGAVSGASRHRRWGGGSGRS
jgi:hypothetical protein